MLLVCIGARFGRAGSGRRSSLTPHCLEMPCHAPLSRPKPLQAQLSSARAELAELRDQFEDLRCGSGLFSVQLSSKEEFFSFCLAAPQPDGAALPSA